MSSVNNNSINEIQYESSIKEKKQKKSKNLDQQCQRLFKLLPSREDIKNPSWETVCKTAYNYFAYSDSLFSTSLNLKLSAIAHYVFLAYQQDSNSEWSNKFLALYTQDLAKVLQEAYENIMKEGFVGDAKNERKFQEVAQGLLQKYSLSCLSPSQFICEVCSHLDSSEESLNIFYLLASLTNFETNSLNGRERSTLFEIYIAHFIRISDNLKIEEEDRHLNCLEGYFRLVKLLRCSNGSIEKIRESLSKSLLSAVQDGSQLLEIIERYSEHPRISHPDEYDRLDELCSLYVHLYGLNDKDEVIDLWQRLISNSIETSSKFVLMRLAEIERSAMDEDLKRCLVDDSLEEMEFIGFEQGKNIGRRTLLNLVQFYLEHHRHARAYEVLKNLDKEDRIAFLEKMGKHYLDQGAYERAILFFSHLKKEQNSKKEKYSLRKHEKIKVCKSRARIEYAEKLIKTGNLKIEQAQEIRKKASQINIPLSQFRTVRKMNMLESLGQNLINKGFYLKQEQESFYQKGVRFWKEKVIDIEKSIVNTNKIIDFLSWEIGNGKKTKERADKFLQKAKEDNTQRHFPYQKEHFLMLAEEAGSREASEALLDLYLQHGFHEYAENQIKKMEERLGFFGGASTAAAFYLEKGDEKRAKRYLKQAITALKTELLLLQQVGNDEEKKALTDSLEENQKKLEEIQGKKKPAEKKNMYSKEVEESFSKKIQSENKLGRVKLWETYLKVRDNKEVIKKKVVLAGGGNLKALELLYWHYSVLQDKENADKYLKDFLDELHLRTEDTGDSPGKKNLLKLIVEYGKEKNDERYQKAKKLNDEYELIEVLRRQEKLNKKEKIQKKKEQTLKNKTEKKEKSISQALENDESVENFRTLSQLYLEGGEDRNNPLFYKERLDYLETLLLKVETRKKKNDNETVRRIVEEAILSLADQKISFLETSDEEKRLSVRFSNETYTFYTAVIRIYERRKDIKKLEKILDQLKDFEYDNSGLTGCREVIVQVSKILYALKLQKAKDPQSKGDLFLANEFYKEALTQYHLVKEWDKNLFIASKVTLCLLMVGENQKGKALLDKAEMAYNQLDKKKRSFEITNILAFGYLREKNLDKADSLIKTLSVMAKESKEEVQKLVYEREVSRLLVYRALLKNDLSQHREPLRQFLEEEDPLIFFEFGKFCYGNSSSIDLEKILGKKIGGGKRPKEFGLQCMEKAALKNNIDANVLLGEIELERGKTTGKHSQNSVLHCKKAVEYLYQAIKGGCEKYWETLYQLYSQSSSPSKLFEEIDKEALEYLKSCSQKGLDLKKKYDDIVKKGQNSQKKELQKLQEDLRKEKIEFPEIEMKISFSLGELSYGEQNWNEAIGFYKAAKVFAYKVDDLECLKKISLGLAWIYFKDEGKKCLTECLNIIEMNKKEKVDGQMMTIYLLGGMAAIQVKEADQAITLFNEIIKNGDDYPFLEAAAWIRLGVAYEMKQKYEKAEESIFKGIEAFEKARKEKRSIVFADIVNGSYEEAFFLLSKLERRKAKAFSEEKNLKAACEHYEKAIDYIKKGPGFKKNESHMKELFNLYYLLCNNLKNQNKSKLLFQKGKEFKQIDWSPFQIPKEKEKELKLLLNRIEDIGLTPKKLDNQKLSKESEKYYHVDKKEIDLVEINNNEELDTFFLKKKNESKDNKKTTPKVDREKVNKRSSMELEMNNDKLKKNKNN